MVAFLRCNGRAVHYAYRPADGGAAIVFANSLGTDLRIWDAVVARIPRHIPVLQYDKRGHGLSEGGPIDIFILADDLGASVRSLAVPTLYIAGSDDRATPPDRVQALADRIPSPRYTCLDGVGHLPCIEAPQAVVDAVLDCHRVPG